MLYLIEIDWKARASESGKPAQGTTVQAEFARSLNAAITKAKTKFRRHYGMHRAITSASEKQDPAGIYQP